MLVNQLTKKWNFYTFIKKDLINVKFIFKRS